MDEWPWFIPTSPPSDEAMARAMQLARESGTLTDDGFIWEHNAPWRSKLKWKWMNACAWLRLRLR